MNKLTKRNGIIFCCIFFLLLSYCLETIPASNEQGNHNSIHYSDIAGNKDLDQLEAAPYTMDYALFVRPCVFLYSRTSQSAPGVIPVPISQTLLPGYVLSPLSAFFFTASNTNAAIYGHINFLKKIFSRSLPFRAGPADLISV